VVPCVPLVFLSSLPRLSDLPGCRCLVGVVLLASAVGFGRLSVFGGVPSLPRQLGLARQSVLSGSLCSSRVVFGTVLT
jgi:hypothetical protein